MFLFCNIGEPYDIRPRCYNERRADAVEHRINQLLVEIPKVERQAQRKKNLHVQVINMKNELKRLQLENKSVTK